MSMFYTLMTEYSLSFIFKNKCLINHRDKMLPLLESNRNDEKKNILMKNAGTTELLLNKLQNNTF